MNPALLQKGSNSFRTDSEIKDHEGSYCMFCETGWNNINELRAPHNGLYGEKGISVLTTIFYVHRTKPIFRYEH